MRRTLEDAAARAASAAGIRIRPLTDIGAMHEVTSLFAQVWGTGSDNNQLPPELLRAMVHAGNYAAGAYDLGGRAPQTRRASDELRSSDGAELVGAVVGFLGSDADGVYLHSHILGVSPRRRGGNIGFALKQHQRAWALDQGLRKVTWTFDPLVRRNAHFNLQKLGAHATRYYESFYGSMLDGINAGDESDRLLIEWRLDDESASRAASARIPEPELDGRKRVLTNDDGEPRAAAVNGSSIVCATPEDIVSLRRADPASAMRWRRALRETLGDAMQDGYQVIGFARSGWYVLEKNGA